MNITVTRTKRSRESAEYICEQQPAGDGVGWGGSRVDETNFVVTIRIGKV